MVGDGERLLRAEDLAARFRVSRATIYNMVRSGILRAVMFKTCGNRWSYRFREEEASAFVEANLRDGVGT